MAKITLADPILYTFSGASAGDRFGFSVSGAGDMNGDGFDDVLVGASYDDTNGSNSGSAWAFSGADGSVMYVWYGDRAEDQFGRDVSGAGDVNCDGFADVIVGSLDLYARVFSGPTGELLRQINVFGARVAGVGDIDGDGCSDIVIGSPPEAARVFSGYTGQLLYTFNGLPPFELGLGTDVAGVGDADGDQTPDIVVGDSYHGVVYLFSGANGGLIYQINSGGVDDFGESVSGLGDLDGDGFGDFIVGAYNPPFGSAHVFTGASGSEVYSFSGDSVSGVGDLDKDGQGDFLIGAPGVGPPGVGSYGQARLYSGGTGAQLATVFGAAPFDFFGAAVSGAGDVDGDGFPDFVIGANDADVGATDNGMARVFSGAEFVPCVDNDGDGFGAIAGVPACGSLDGDCNDADPSVNPTAVETCNGVDDDCSGVIDDDADLDGFDPCAGDCDESDPGVSPGAVELCNGVDDDCDGATDEDFDTDGDGVPTCAGDCDDANPNVNPGHPEVCDGIDNDCDAAVDEGFDADGDGFTGCGGDCNDGDASIHPGAPEIPNDGIDQNCNGSFLCGGAVWGAGPEGAGAWAAYLATLGAIAGAIVRRRGRR